MGAQFNLSLHGVRVDLVSAGIMAVSGAKAGWRAFNYLRSRDWPVVHGKCTLAELEPKGKLFRLKLLYSYKAPTQKYGDAGEFTKDFADEHEGRAWSEALRQGAVPVRYNPSKPSQSILWESDLEAIAQGKQPPPATAPQQAELQSWERICLPGLLLISGILFFFSLWAHGYALAGAVRIQFGTFMAMHVFSVLLLLAAIAVARNQSDFTSFGKFVAAWPPWLRVPAYFFLVYAALNFAVFVMQGPIRIGAGHELTPGVVRGLSGHWMLLFLAEFALFYHRLRLASQTRLAAHVPR